MEMQVEMQTIQATSLTSVTQNLEVVREYTVGMKST